MPTTGPKTPEGKARVSQNARKHGLCGKRLSVDPEDQQAFDDLRAEQLAEYNPASSTEQHLFEEILHSIWTVERARLRQSLLEDSLGLGGIDTEEEATQKEYDRLERYATRANNNWFRCRKMIKIVQNQRIAEQLQAEQEQTGQRARELMNTANADAEDPPAASPAPVIVAAEDGPEYSALAEQLSHLDFTRPEEKAKGDKLIHDWFFAQMASAKL